MKLRLSELDCAVRDVLHAMHPARFPEFAREAAGTQEADPELTFDQAGLAVGGLLVAASLGHSVDAEQAVLLANGLSLASVRVDGAAEEPIYLPAPAVAAHPLFGPWVSQQFPDVLAHMLKAGAIWTQLSFGAPVFEELQVTDYGGAILGAHLRLVWAMNNGTGASLVVTASYGATGLDVPLRRVLAIKSNTLVAIGAGTPLVDESARADEAAAANAIKTAAHAAGASLH